MSGYVAIVRSNLYVMNRMENTVNTHFILDDEWDEFYNDKNNNITYYTQVDSLEDFKNFILSHSDTVGRDGCDKILTYKTPFKVNKPHNKDDNPNNPNNIGNNEYTYYMLVGSLVNNIKYKEDKYGIRLINSYDTYSILHINTTRIPDIMLRVHGHHIPYYVNDIRYESNSTYNVHHRVQNDVFGMDNNIFIDRIDSSIINYMLRDLHITCPIEFNKEMPIGSYYIGRMEFEYIKTIWFIQNMTSLYKQSIKCHQSSLIELAIKYPINYNVKSDKELKISLMTYAMNHDYPLEPCSGEIQQLIDNWKYLVDNYQYIHIASIK